jgi:hypothetical protein
MMGMNTCSLLFFLREREYTYETSKQFTRVRACVRVCVCVCVVSVGLTILKELTDFNKIWCRY